jgi:hypothetical protein
MIWPSLIHWMVGSGVPLTKVRNWTGLPSTTLTSSRLVNDGGTSPESRAVKAQKKVQIEIEIEIEIEILKLKCKEIYR